MTTKEIQIRVKEITTKEGKKFNAYKAVTKDGKLVDCRFTKEVKNAPTQNATIVVPLDKMNFAKNTVFPVLWVKEIQEVKLYQANSEELIKALNDLF